MDRSPDLALIAETAERCHSTGGVVLARQRMAAHMRELTHVRDGRFLADLALQWLVIGLAFGLAVYSGHWAAYAAAAAVIATRQHALGILLHDGTHYRLLSNRALNDAVCDLFCAFPVGMATSRYRHEHLLHHRFLNTDRDPYWVDFQRDDNWHWPKQRGAALWVFFKDLTLLNLPRWMAVVNRWSPWANHLGKQSVPPPLTRAERLRLYAFYAVVLGVLAATGAWLDVLLLWLLPSLTLTMALVRLRTIGEHLAIPNRNELDASRHTDGTLLEHLTVSPFNINFHLDHHLFPAVPYYNLPALHRLLLADPDYCQHAILNRSYFGRGKGGLLGEIISRS